VASALANDAELDDDETFAAQNVLDDEYATAGNPTSSSLLIVPRCNSSKGYGDYQS
jgi:hypothetical protein